MKLINLYYSDNSLNLNSNNRVVIKINLNSNNRVIININLTSNNRVIIKINLINIDLNSNNPLTLNSYYIQVLFLI